MPHLNTDNTSANPDANPVERHDIAAAKWLTQARHYPAVRAASAIGEIGHELPVLATAGAVVAWGLLSGDRHLARGGGHMLASVVLASALEAMVKLIVARTRPHLLLDEGVYEAGLLGPNEKSWRSFPSGHVAGSVALARSVARGWPRASIAAYTGAAAVALTRLPRGTHYPSDLLAGALIGTAAETIVARLFPLG